MQPILGITLVCLLVCSTAVAVESRSGAAPCEARSFDFGQKAVGWKHQPLSKLTRDTVDTLKQEEGRTVLHADAHGSASLYVARFKKVAVY